MVEIKENYLTAVEVSKYVGVSNRTVETWAAKGFIDRANGKYGLISAMKYRLEKVNKDMASYKEKLDVSELRKQKLQADVDTQKAVARIKLVEAEREEGKLVDAEEVADLWNAYVIRCRSKLLSIPVKLAYQLASLKNEIDIQNLLQANIDEALRELSSNQDLS